MIKYDPIPSHTFEIFISSSIFMNLVILTFEFKNLDIIVNIVKIFTFLKKKYTRLVSRHIRKKSKLINFNDINN